MNARLSVVFVALVFMTANVWAENNGKISVSKDAMRDMLRNNFQESFQEIDAYKNFSQSDLFYLADCISDDLNNIAFLPGEIRLDEDTIRKRLETTKPLSETILLKCVSKLFASMAPKQKVTDADNFDKSGIGRNAALSKMREFGSKAIENNKSGLSPNVLTYVSNCLIDDLVNIIYHAGETWLDLDTFSRRLETVKPLNEIIIRKCTSKLSTDRTPEQRGGDEGRQTYASGSPKLDSTGSGAIVSTDGFVLTNNHVVNDCTNITIRDTHKEVRRASIFATDERSDLAILKITESVSLPAASFRAGASADTGESVVALGFPLAGLLASEVNVSFGYISATAGLADDTGQLQISAPVQPGNSGGPLLDQSGNIVGVVVSKLDALKLAKANGDIPQNINFAVKGEIAQVFLKAHRVKFKTAASNKKLENTDIANSGRAFTVLVGCFK